LSSGFAGVGTDSAVPSGTVQEPCTIDGKPCLTEPDAIKANLFREVWNETDDPGKDGWDTEVFNNIANKQLKKIGKMLTHPEQLDSGHAAELIIDDFTTNGLRPQHVQPVFQEDDLTVTRQKPLPLEKAPTKDTIYSGREGFLSALKDLATPFQGADDYRFKFKLFRVQKNSDFVITRQYFALSGLTDRGMLEQNSTWDIRWVQKGTEPPQIASITVTDFEEVAGKTDNGKLFQDITASVLQNNTSFGDQILHGYPEHLGSIENTLDFNVFGTPGLAVGDINGDGLDDLYVCQEQGLPNLLYVQNEDGSASDISSAAGVNWLESSRSALFLDLDNDGDQDLVVAMPGAVIVAANDGEGNFSITKSLAIADDPMSMAGADYDSDGDIDLFVALYSPNRVLEKSEKPDRGSDTANFVYHDANNGPANFLFRNDTAHDKWNFTDVTASSGIDINNRRFSLSASWEDYDNDGDPDLYVANDYGRDNLYRNDTSPGGAPRFTDVASQAKIEDSAGSMGVSWGDYNRDGFMDSFISAMWSSAGNRITYQSEFKGDDPEVKERLQRFAHGNTMLKNNGDGTFSDLSEDTGIEMGRWAWSSNFVDINNDGWEDLVVTNGFLTGDEKGGDL
jgi:FG-GAP-like repeat